MFTASKLGINEDDANYLNMMVRHFYADGVDNLWLKATRKIENIHTGHYIYLGIVYGLTTATFETKRSLFTQILN